MFNIEGLKTDSAKSAMASKCDSVSLEAAHQYLHMLVETKVSRRDATPYLKTLQNDKYVTGVIRKIPHSYPPFICKTSCSFY